MTEQEFDQAIDEVFLNTNGIDIPFINRGFYQDGIVIDGFIRYEDLIKLGEVVKQYVESE
jgi:hypothetical protein